MMKQVIALAGFAALMVVSAPVAVVTPAAAQTKQTCGVAAYSVADQKYVSLPCTAETPKAEAGKPAPCGVIAYSVADQKYVGLPCTTDSPTVEPERWTP
jgi:hypothetical protein